MGFQATATMPVAKYTTHSSLPFTIIRKAGALANVANSELQDYPNNCLGIAICLWEILIQEKTGISLKDIGFSNLDI